MTVMPAGGLFGLPGFGSVPPKLIRRILAKEYVDIWELLPEPWQVESAHAAMLNALAGTS